MHPCRSELTVENQIRHAQLDSFLFIVPQSQNRAATFYALPALLLHANTAHQSGERPVDHLATIKQWLDFTAISTVDMLFPILTYEPKDNNLL
jgi:hypothetical protein